MANIKPVAQLPSFIDPVESIDDPTKSQRVKIPPSLAGLVVDTRHARVRQKKNNNNKRWHSVESILGKGVLMLLPLGFGCYYPEKCTYGEDIDFGSKLTYDGM